MTLKELIESIDGLAGQDYQAIALRLNEKPRIPNPETQRDVPKPLRSVDELFGLILEGGNFEQDMGALTTCAQFLSIGKVFGEYCSIPFTGPLAEVVGLLQMPVFNLSEATADAVRARLAEVMPDPDWPAEVDGLSIAQEKGFEFVRPEQVQGALS